MSTGLWRPPAVWKRCCKMAIKLLDDGLINKIAAGEVIERPASIVKELVENAIDAGSTRISVGIAGGGIERIEITDNGSGITRNDVSLAFKRHATSKISREADLQNIVTMGFRGEALPSIASISRLEIYTQFGGQAGVRAFIEGGGEAKIEAHPTAPGTRIIVKDVFFNTPARKKFLKTPVSEGIHIHDIVCRMALSRPDISFTFANEKKLYFKTPGNGNIRDTVISIYGGDYAANFLDLAWRGEDYSLHGMISKPQYARVNRKNQIFYVNRRWVKSALLNRAVDEAYRGLLLAREYPAVLLFITVPPAEVDVNVHPQKAEVRFRDEKVIFRLISHGVRDRLENRTASAAVSNPEAFPNLTYKNATTGFYPGTRQTMEGISTNDDNLFGDGDLIRAISKYQDLDDTGNADMLKEDGGFAVIGQCFDSYILVEKDEELWVVDQHAAHERIMYSRLLDRSAGTDSHSQLLAFPLTLDISGIAMDLLTAHQQIFRDIGFEIEAIGPNSLIIRSAPAMLQGSEIEVVSECLQLLEEGSKIDLKKEILATVACKQAVKAGQSMSRQEMAILINDLLQVKDYKHCPHGRPTMLELSHSELDKRFKRK